MSILVVDDNTALLSRIVRSLVKTDRTVHTATNITEARDVLEESTPEVMCLDLHLPDGSGLDFLRDLREEGRSLPVIIVSGADSDENRERALKLGATGFLAKPFLLSDLHDLLDGVLKSNATARRECDLLQGEEIHSANSQIGCEPISSERVASAKKAYSTRRVSFKDAQQLIKGDYQPKAGDLVLARVDKLNQHKRLELVDGRRATLFENDEIIVCYGNRYAPDQFEAEIPSDLSPCNLVAAGGIASKSLSRNTKVRHATRISPIGVLADADGVALNLSCYGIGVLPLPTHRPPVTAVIGTSMNAGKTTTAANIALGMTRKGIKVGAAKVTGTGAGGDVWHLTDAGCHSVLDFTDYGVPSTYKLSIESCERIFESLLAQLCADGAEAVVIEIADGILQKETRELVTSPLFKQLVDNVVFAAGDALGAANGIDWLHQQGIDVVGVSGALTAAPLAVRECAEVISVPVLTKQMLNGGDWSPFSIDGNRESVAA